MSEEKMYELRVDVSYPGAYYRAGTQKTEKQWQKIFGNINMDWMGEWFIDLEVQNIIKENDELRNLVDAVFERNRLKSLSYKDVAYEIAELWLKQNQNK